MLGASKRAGNRVTGVPTEERGLESYAMVVATDTSALLTTRYRAVSGAK